MKEYWIAFKDFNQHLWWLVSRIIWWTILLRHKDAKEAYKWLKIHLTYPSIRIK